MNSMIELQRLLSKVHMFLLKFLYEKFTCMILLFLKATTCIFFFFFCAMDWYLFFQI